MSAHDPDVARGLAARLTHLARLVSAGPSGADGVRAEGVDLVVDLLPGVQHASITEQPDGGDPLTTVASDEVALWLDAVQYGAGTGPCVDAVRTGAVTGTDDLPGSARWPGWVEGIGAGISSGAAPPGADGVRSVRSHPLTTGGAPAALNLYSTRTAFPVDDVPQPAVVAAVASLVLASLAAREV